MEVMAHTVARGYSPVVSGGLIAVLETGVRGLWGNRVGRRSRAAALPRIDPDRWARLCGSLRARVTARLIEVGELLGGSELSPTEGEDQVLHDYLLALDAHAAAGKLLDEAADLPELAGVSVLLDIATAHFKAATARHAGHHPAHHAHRCFYNPLHGPAVNDPESRRGKGSKRRRSRSAQVRATVPACAECLHRIRADQTPDVLVAPVTVATKKRRITGVPVPYFLVPADQSLWAATGYGTLPGHSDTELVARVLRGEYRGGHSQ
jgi:hypothetical protein